MQLCRQYGFIFICEILLVLNCESHPSNLRCDPATSYIYLLFKEPLTWWGRVLVTLGEIAEVQVNASFVPLSST